MTSKHVPPPVKHPRFIPVGNRQDQAANLVREALRQAFELTPWEKAVVLNVHRDDFQDFAAAVADIAGPLQSKRVYLNTVHRKDPRQEKRIMIDPHSGTEYLKGPTPWGDPPEPETLCPKCGMDATGPGLAFASDGTICDGPDEGPDAHALHSRPAES